MKVSAAYVITTGLINRYALPLLRTNAHILRLPFAHARPREARVPRGSERTVVCVKLVCTGTGLLFEEPNPTGSYSKHREATQTGWGVKEKPDLMMMFYTLMVLI